ATPEVLMAALAKIAQGEEPLLLKESDRPDLSERAPRGDRPERGDRFRDRGEGRGRGDRGGERTERGPRRRSTPDEGMQRYKLEVGHAHGVKPGNIVGAIANEAGIESKHIGAIEIYDNYSTVDLPQGMPAEIRQILQKARVAGQRM
ncbi:DbpA RNA binding domain-containing protein, partial [Bowmanella dokdonensis]